MESNYILITDGAYSSSRQQMGVGFVLLKNDKIVHTFSKGVKGGTNNQAEMLAIITGISSFKKNIDSLKIITDSQYCLGCATMGWSRNKNQLLWKKFDKYYSQLKELCSNIEWIHVRGHGKDNSPYSKYNQIADELAVQGSHEVL